MKTISIIIPCYNEEEVIYKFYDCIEGVYQTMKDRVNFEYVFVNDGSKDKTKEILIDLSKKDSKVRYISFSRNFGKESAMLAGFKNCTGDYGATMDVDLQDPPSLLPEMLDILESGEYDVVATRRGNRKGEPPIRSALSKAFYRVINHGSQVKIASGSRDFRLMTRSVIDAIIYLNEHDRFSKGLFNWVGFRTYWLSFENIKRAGGETKWSIKQLFNYSITGIVDFNSTPLKLSFLLCFLCELGFLGLLIAQIVLTCVNHIPFMSLYFVLSILCFLIGLVFLVLGIEGVYLSKIFFETKDRPHYIVAESNIEDINKIV